MSGWEGETFTGEMQTVIKPALTVSLPGVLSYPSITSSTRFAGPAGATKKITCAADVDIYRDVTDEE